MSLKKFYHQDLAKCMKTTEQISKIAPGKTVYFTVDSFKKFVVAEGLNRSELHQLSRVLHRTFYFRVGCGGKKQAVSDKDGLEIIVQTNMECPNCQKRIPKGAGFARFFLEHLRRTNWKATIFWTFKMRVWTWIGKGWNPDYTQSCTVGGTCTCKSGTDCSTSDPGCVTQTCSCSCPSALANSTYVSDSCDPLYAGNCLCTGTPKKCASLRTCTCNCGGGACSYNCDAGYTWNGVACVSAEKPQVYILKPREGDRRSRLWYSG